MSLISFILIFISFLLLHLGNYASPSIFTSTSPLSESILIMDGNGRGEARHDSYNYENRTSSFLNSSPHILNTQQTYLQSSHQSQFKTQIQTRNLNHSHAEENHYNCKQIKIQNQNQSQIHDGFQSGSSSQLIFDASRADWK